MVSRISRERPDIVQSIGNVYFHEILLEVCAAMHI